METIFFTVLEHHGFAHALTRILWWQVGALGLTLALSPMLPLRGRPDTEFGLPATPAASEAATPAASDAFA